MEALLGEEKEAEVGLTGMGTRGTAGPDSLQGSHVSL